MECLKDQMQLFVPFRFFHKLALSPIVYRKGAVLIIVYMYEHIRLGENADLNFLGRSNNLFL